MIVIIIGQEEQTTPPAVEEENPSTEPITPTESTDQPTE
jgi:hypothetical protein